MEITRFAFGGCARATKVPRIGTTVASSIPVMGGSMKNLLNFTMVLGLLTAGCAWERTSAPQAQEPARDQVR